MPENCKEIDCREPSQYLCVCNPEVRLCSVHMMIHVRQSSGHRPILLSEAQESLNKKIKQEMISLSKIISLAFGEGKCMAQEILDKVDSISKDMTRRQKELLELASSGRLGPEIDKEIMDIGSVTLSLNKTQAFRHDIGRHFNLEYGGQEEVLFRRELENLANHINESNAIFLRLLEENHNENSEILGKFANIENENGIRNIYEQMKKDLEQTQSENNDLRLKIDGLEKYTQNCRKDIAENKIFSMNLKIENINDIKILKQEINELKSINDSIVQENQRHKEKLERKIDNLLISDIFSRIPKEKNEIKRNVADIEKQIIKFKSQIEEAVELVKQKKRKQELREKREKETRDKAEKEQREREKREKEAKNKAEAEKIARERRDKEAKDKIDAELKAREEEERLKKLEAVKEEIARIGAAEREKTNKIYEKTIALENEYKELLDQIRNQLEQVVPKNVIQYSDLNSIFNNDPNYVPKPNDIQSEVKAIYTTIRESIYILSDCNIELSNIINSAAPAGDRTSVNNHLINAIIPKLELSKESCRSFANFMYNFVLHLLVSLHGTHQAIKISNDRNYYFMCTR